jgi:protein TonB
MKKVALLIISILFINIVLAQTDSAQKMAPEKIFTIVEQMPEYTGGEKELFKFIQMNVQYPAMERDNHIQGTVIVGFVINEDGSVRDLEIKKSVSVGLDKEAQRVVKKLKFNPGMQAGETVKVSYKVPVDFILK